MEGRSAAQHQGSQAEGTHRGRKIFELKFFFIFSNKEEGSQGRFPTRPTEVGAKSEQGYTGRGLVQALFNLLGKLPSIFVRP